jgi:soluble lytic murein transglycosylase-like protein
MRFLLTALLFCGVGFETAQAQHSTNEMRYYADAYADHYQVPRALVHAIVEQESGWNPSALSGKGAAGLMQLMPATAHAYDVQDRYDVNQSLSGGIQYLADLLREFNGDMRLAVAAYYCGSRHLERQGLSYGNPEVVAYVESVRRRYRRDLGSNGLGANSSKGGQ